MTRIVRTARLLERRIDATADDIDPQAAGELLAAAYPDRIALNRQQKPGHFILASGKGAILPEHDPLARSEMLVAAELDGNPSNARIFLAAPCDPDWFQHRFRHRIQSAISLDWDVSALTVRARTRLTYQHLVLSTCSADGLDAEQGRRVIFDGLSGVGPDALPWSTKMHSLRQRCIFLHRTGLFSDLPDLSDANLIRTLDTWLGPFLLPQGSRMTVTAQALAQAFDALVPWPVRQRLDRHAPTHFTVPSGSRIRLRYLENGALLDNPVLAVKLQEMFGLEHTPCLPGTKIPVLLHLLSPAGRPVQVTKDLNSFWDTTYHEIKKDLKGRYPKHPMAG